MENAVKLNEAFCSFTQASKSLETYYKELHKKVQYLTMELEEKNLELKNAISEVKEAKDYLYAVLQSIEEAIVVLDQDEKITMINRAAEELFRLNAGNAAGKAFNELDFSIDDSNSDTTLTIKGKRHNIILSRSTVSDSGGHVILIKDITRLKELEQQQERNQRLVSMGEMAAKIVHEIRNPLCSVELFSNMLSKDLEGTPHAEMAQGISTGIRSLNNILTNMLFFAKPQKPLFKDIEISNVIEDSIKMLIPLMETRKINLFKDITDETIVGDQELLKQVFMNILLNAVQTMPDGGTLNVTVALTPVRKFEGGFLSKGATGEFVIVSIADEGDGISPENTEKIFDPFFSTKDRGTGLGLTIAHRIMQCHKGFIKANNNDGKGSTFCLYFPKNNNSVTKSQRSKTYFFNKGI